MIADENWAVVSSVIRDVSWNYYFPLPRWGIVQLSVRLVTRTCPLAPAFRGGGGVWGRIAASLPPTPLALSRRQARGQNLSLLGPRGRASWAPAAGGIMATGVGMTCRTTRATMRMAQGWGVTGREQLAAALRASEAKYRTLYDSSRDAIMILTPAEGFLSGNPAAAELFGCQNEDEFTALSPAKLSPDFQPDGLPSSVKAQQMMARALAAGSHAFDWTHQRVDGTEFRASVLLTRMELEGRLFLQATVRDITEQQRAAESSAGRERVGRSGEPREEHVSG